MAVPNVGQLVAATLEAKSSQITDQIMVGTRTLKALNMKPGFKKKQMGGREVFDCIQYAENGNGRWMGEFDNYATIPQEVLDEAKWDWKSLTSTIIVTNKDRVKNSGKYQTINLVTAKYDNMIESLSQDMNRVIFSDGSVAKEPEGLRKIVSTTGTYGNIARSGNTWWQGQVDSTTELFSISDMRSLWQLCSANVTAPDVIVTTRDIYNYYEGLVQSFQQIAQSNTGDLGFEHLKFKGVPLFWDDDCPPGSLYMLNSKYLNLWCHPDWEFKRLPILNVDQPLEVHPVEWWGNFTCRGPRYQGVMSNKTVA